MDTSAERRDGRDSTSVKSFKREEMDVISNLTGLRIAPIAVDYKVVEVEVGFSDITREYLKSLFNAMSNVTSSHGGTMTFELKNLLSYCASILKARVARVVMENPGLKPMDRILVPSFYAVVLSTIGIAVDHERGIELRPKLAELKDIVLMSDDEVREFSRKLIPFQSLGFKFALGYPKDNRGDFEAMALSVVDQFVRGENSKAHPALAIVAGMLNQRHLEVVLSPRVNYVPTALLKSIIGELAQPTIT